MARYAGIIATVPPKGHFGFVGIGSATNVDGSPHDLDTDQDIFVHQDECDQVLRVGMEITFSVISDDSRGEGTYRAQGASEVRELVLADAGGGVPAEVAPQSRALTTGADFYTPPTPAQQNAKPIEPQAVQEVVLNKPMASMPRAHTDVDKEDTEEEKRNILRRLFPQLFTIEETEGGDIASEKFFETVQASIENHKSIGMLAQAELLHNQAQMHRDMQAFFGEADAEDLLCPETVIPLECLPDLFMAAPVWFFVTDEGGVRLAQEANKEDDPRVPERLKYFCDLHPNQQWVDTFLMFNRRLRTLEDYEGDVVPSKILSRIQKLTDIFDHVVIMTPYHDIAGRDWEDLDWLRSIDPYVFGFKEGLSSMFAIARFSDSGVFPLHCELVADTIAFLRRNGQKLLGFDKVGQPYWYEIFEGVGEQHFSRDQLGTELVEHTQKLLKAFDEGRLFDWLRGEGATELIRRNET